MEYLEVLEVLDLDDVGAVSLLDGLGSDVHIGASLGDRKSFSGHGEGGRARGDSAIGSDVPSHRAATGA